MEAACHALGVDAATGVRPSETVSRDPLLAAWRAQVEGPAFQTSGADVVLGGGGFADDDGPPDALVQLGAEATLAPDFRSARVRTERVQGRNSTVALSHPVAPPEGDWALTLQTSWVEPAYVEPDASWCRPGGTPPRRSPTAARSGQAAQSRPGARPELADEAGAPVRVLWRREDVVRRGPKRPPLAVALREDGTGIVRVGRTDGSPDLAPLAAAVRAACAGVEVEEVEVHGPPVAPDLRAAGWAETLAARHVLTAPRGPVGRGEADVTVPGGGRARVALDLAEGGHGSVQVDVWAGAVMCPVTLRSLHIRGGAPGARAGVE